MDADLIFIAHDNRDTPLGVFRAAFRGGIFGNDQNAPVRREFDSGAEACYAASDNKKIYHFFLHTGRIQDGIE
jgi:hypothetical protein